MLKLIKVTDNGGKTMDRYTAYFKGDGQVDGDYILCMSDYALSSQGVCMSDASKPEYIVNDKGKELEFNDLPDQVQQAITNFIAE